MKRSSLALVLSPSHEIMSITNRRYGGFGLPGGKVEPNETSKAALIREMKEETGIELVHSMGSPVFVHVFTGRWGDARIVSIYLVTFMIGWPVAVEAGTEIRWMDLVTLSQSGPFGEFYRSAFPDGVQHLSPTRWERFGG